MSEEAYSSDVQIFPKRDVSYLAYLTVLIHFLKIQPKEIFTGFKP
jgi:hypothetical protein